MYAITLKQPWAWAVIYAGKDVENRSWPITPQRVLIHAGKAIDEEGIEFITEDLGLKLPPRAFHGGVILGSVEVYDVTAGRSNSPWARRNAYHWLLRDPVKARPQIECRGFPSLWRPPRDWERSFSMKLAS